MFAFDERGKCSVFTEDGKVTPEPGWEIMALIQPDTDSVADSGSTEALKLKNN